MRRWAVALLLVVAACGDSSGTTTTTAPLRTTTSPADTVVTTTERTVPPETFPPETVPPLTTTTSAGIVVPAGALPDLLVPDEFVDRALGSADFGPEPEIFEEGGDWYLLLTRAGSFIPVPAGWEVDDREDAADLSFGDLNEGGAEVFLQRDTTDTDIAELFADIESDLDDGDELFLVEIVDPDHAYLTGASTDDGQRLYAAAVLVVRDGALHILSGGTEAAGWATFEPVFRAMVAGWHDLAGEPLGLELPADLGFPPVDDPGVELPGECAELVDEALVLLQGVLDQLEDVTVEEFEAAGEDVDVILDLAEFEDASEALGLRSLELDCVEEDLSMLLEARLGELAAEGEVAERVLAQLVEEGFTE